MNISGTWPDHMKPRKLPINTNVDTVLVLKDLILLICMADKGSHGYLRPHTRSMIGICFEPA